MDVEFNNEGLGRATILIDGEKDWAPNLHVFAIEFSASISAEPVVVLKCRSPEPADARMKIGNIDHQSVRIEIDGQQYRLVKDEPKKTEEGA